MVNEKLSAAGFLRLADIIGRKAVSEAQARDNKRKGRGSKRARLGITPLIPVSKSAWWAGIKAGKYPQPLKLGPNTTVWRAADIRRLIESL